MMGIKGYSLSGFKPALALILLAPALILAACIGGNSPPVKYYMLDPLQQTGTPPATDGVHIEITAVRLPQYLERPQIVTRNDNNRLVLSEFNQWGGNLRKNLTRTLAINLSGLLQTSNVTIAPYRAPTPPDYRISVEIFRFERDTDNKVYLSSQWRVNSARDQDGSRSMITNLKSTPVNGDDYGAIVTAMKQLFGDFSKTIADEIGKAGN